MQYPCYHNPSQSQLNLQLALETFKSNEKHAKTISLFCTGSKIRHRHLQAMMRLTKAISMARIMRRSTGAKPSLRSCCSRPLPSHWFLNTRRAFDCPQMAPHHIPYDYCYIGAFPQLQERNIGYPHPPKTKMGKREKNCSRKQRICERRKGCRPDSQGKKQHGGVLCQRLTELQWGQSCLWPWDPPGFPPAPVPCMHPGFHVWLPSATVCSL